MYYCSMFKGIRGDTILNAKGGLSTAFGINVFCSYIKVF